MRRMITALAVAVLFVVPGSAFAACAWVLWKHTWKGRTWWTAWWPSQGDRWPPLLPLHRVSGAGGAAPPRASPSLASRSPVGHEHVHLAR
jgi:hypothetical protein